MIVLDASAAIEWIAQSAAGERVARWLFSPAQAIYAPQLLDVEVLQSLRRAVRAGEASPERAAAALQDFLDLPITRHPHEPLLWRIWDLRENLTAYDAASVALAEYLGAPLLTCDSRIRTASGHHARVEVV